MPNSSTPRLTVVELLVVIVISGFMLAAIVQTVVIQQRGHSDRDTAISTRHTHRASLAILQAELRELSASGGDLIVAEPDRLVFRAFRKVGFICDLERPGLQSGAEKAMSRPPDAQLTVWNLGASFEDDDRLLIFADGDGTARVKGEGAWVETRVMAAPDTAGCGGEWARYGDPAGRYETQRLSVSGELATVREGAPVRGFVPMTYEVREMDGHWAIARAEDGAEPDEWVAPIRVPDAERPVFRYFDLHGEVTPRTSAERAAVRRIEVRVEEFGPAQAGTMKRSTSEFVSQVYLRGNAN